MSSAIQIQNAGKSFSVKTSRKGAEDAFVALENIMLEIKAGEFLVRAAAGNQPCSICSAG